MDTTIKSQTLLRPPWRAWLCLDPLISALVWSVWLFLFLVLVRFCLKTHANVPFSEDWFLVAPLTGNEPSLRRWLWSLHNDHRTPIPKLIMLAILKLTHGNFSAVTIFNVVALAAVAAGFIVLARRLRGRTLVSDLLFPIIFLHLGNVENMLWPWQITFVSSVVLICCALALLVDVNWLTQPGGASIFAIVCVLLPLTGGTGILCAFPLLALDAYLWWFLTVKRERNSVGWIYGLSGMLAALVLVAYFVGYTRSDLAQAEVSLGRMVWASTEVLALAFGPATKSLSLLSIVTTLSVVTVTVWTAIRSLRRFHGFFRLRIAGLLLVVITECLYAFALGRGRVVMAYSSYGGWPQRYCLLMSPVLVASYFIWEFCGKRALSGIVQLTMVGVLLLLLPLNTAYGLDWIQVFRRQTLPMLADLQANVPIPVVAKRNERRVFFEKSELERLIPLLRNAGVKPFSTVSATASSSAPDDKSVTAARTFSAITEVTREVRYVIPDAGEVQIAWGVDGWHAVPPKMRPPNTEIVNGIMQSPMSAHREYFSAQIVVPEGSHVEYGFVISKNRAGNEIATAFEWKPSFQFSGYAGRSIEVTSGLKMMDGNFLMYAGDGDPTRVTIRYHLPDARTVEMDWGVNGWFAVPPSMRPSGSTVQNGIMAVRMARQGGYFTADLTVPNNSSVDYSFLITRKDGLLERIFTRRFHRPAGQSYLRILGPLLEAISRADLQPVYVNDRPYHVDVVAPGIVEVWPDLQLGEEALLPAIPRRKWFLSATLFALIFLLLGCALTLRERTAVVSRRF